MQSRVGLFVVSMIMSAGAAGQSGDRWMLQLGIDPSQTTSNTLQRPNNSTTTRFDITDFTGENITLGRFSMAHRVDWGKADAELRLDIVPFQQSGTRDTTSTIRFNGTVFEAGVPLRALYQFNTYRLSYDVPLFTQAAPDTWNLRLGGDHRDPRCRGPTAAARLAHELCQLWARPLVVRVLRVAADRPMARRIGLGWLSRARRRRLGRYCGPVALAGISSCVGISRHSLSGRRSSPGYLLRLSSSAQRPRRCAIRLLTSHRWR